MPPQRKVEFKFDERSLVPVESVIAAGDEVTEVIMSDPNSTSGLRRLYIPKPRPTCPHCGQPIQRT